MLLQIVFLCDNIKENTVGVFKMYKRSEVQELDKIINFKIPHIKDEVHFWMVRTQGGHFYQEFISAYDNFPHCY